MSDPGRLGSWKEIAAFLGREVRTVQRWEASEGLPVHRLGHQKGGTVYAFPAELDAWMKARTGPPKEAAASSESAAAWEPPAPRAEASRAGVFTPRAHATGLWIIAGVLVIAGAWAGVRHVWGGAEAPPAAASEPAPRARRWFAAATSENASWRMAEAGPSPSRLVLARDGSELYVANDAAHSLTVLDAGSLRKLATLPLASAPNALAATPDGGLVLAASVDGGGLNVVDARTRTVRRIALDGGVSAMAVTPDGATLYVAQRYDGLASVQLASGAIRHVTTSACPTALAMAPDGRTLYVGYQCGGPAGRAGHDTIGVFDLATQRFTGFWGGQDAMVASALQITPDGSQLWASAGDACVAPEYDHAGCPPGAAGVVYAYSTSDGRRLGRIVTDGASPVNNIVFLAGGMRALLDNRIVDTTRHEVLEALPVTAGRSAVSADGQRVYLPVETKNAVAEFALPPTLCAPPAPDLTAWWPGDGSTADAWGALQGSARGVGYAPGKVGQAFVFAPDAELDLGHDSTLARAWRDSLSVAAWVKMAGSLAGVILQKESADGRRGWRLAETPTESLALCWADGTGCVTTAPLGSGSWHLVAVSARHDGTVTIYVDGRAAGSGRYPESVTAPLGDLIAGGAHGFTGMLDELVVYGKALDASGLSALQAMPACVQGGAGRLN